MFCEPKAKILYIYIYNMAITWQTYYVTGVTRKEHCMYVTSYLRYPHHDNLAVNSSNPVWIFHIVIIIWKTSGFLNDQSTAFPPIDHVDTTWCASWAETRLLHSHTTTMTIQLQQWMSVNRKHARMSMVFVYTRMSKTTLTDKYGETVKGMPHHLSSVRADKITIRESG